MAAPNYSPLSSRTHRGNPKSKDSWGGSVQGDVAAPWALARLGGPVESSGSSGSVSVGMREWVRGAAMRGVGALQDGCLVAGRRAPGAAAAAAAAHRVPVTASGQHGSSAGRWARRPHALRPTLPEGLVGHHRRRDTAPTQAAAKQQQAQQQQEAQPQVSTGKRVPHTAALPHPGTPSWMCRGLASAAAAAAPV